jgi:hypothetical protein
MNPTRVLSYANRCQSRVLIILEPWAERYWIQPGQQVDIHAVQERNVVRPGDWELVQTAEGLIVYGWAGSVLSIFCGGSELAPDCE